MKKWLKNLKKENGFTLVEMSIVILVIAILIVVLLPNLTKVNENVSSTTDKALKQNIEAQMILYEAEKGTQPSIEQLISGGYITSDQGDAYSSLSKE